MRIYYIIFISCVFLFLAACSFTKPRTTADFDMNSADHLTIPNKNANIPELISFKELLEINNNNNSNNSNNGNVKNNFDNKIALYSLMAHDAPMRETLLGLAKSAKINIDIHPNVEGNITLNAIQEPLAEILDRICEQTDTRWSKKNNHILVELDAPYLKHYSVDYLNMDRDLEAKVSTNTQIVTQSQINTNLNSTNSNNNSNNLLNSNNEGSNISSTLVKNKTNNNFWKSLEENIKDILRETDKILPDGSSETEITTESNNENVARANSKNILNSNSSSSSSNSNKTIKHSTFKEAASVIINKETGIISVRATQKQHKKINEFIQQVFSTAKRQVLIEATIIEVLLSDNYQQGIDWKKITGLGMFSFIGNPLVNEGVNISYINDNDRSVLVNFLENFGETKVLSSPHLAVLNNQTAMLKVVENYVYFNVKADTISTANVGITTTYSSTPQTVSVGVVMSVTPQISNDNIVMLNVRPTITQIAYTVADPNPDLQKNNIQNLLPVIDTREIESVLRIKSGQTAILGGLMKDEINLKRSTVPVLGNIPLLGEVFNNFNHTKKKSELIILLRPLVIKQ